MLERFDQVEGDLSARQLQRLRPAPELRDTLDVDVVAGGIDVFVDRDQRRLHHVETGQPRAGNVGQHAGGGLEQRLPDVIESRPQVDCHENDGGERWRLGRAVLDHAHGLAKAQPPAEQRRETAPLLALAALGQLHKIEMAKIERQFLRRAVSAVRDRLETLQDDLLQRGRHLRAESPRRNRIEPDAIANPGNACRAAERQLAAGHLINDRAQRIQIAALVGANPQ